MSDTSQVPVRPSTGPAPIKSKGWSRFIDIIDTAVANPGVWFETDATASSDGSNLKTVAWRRHRVAVEATYRSNKDAPGGTLYVRYNPKETTASG